TVVAVEPSAIVERTPAPIPIADPGPTVVGVNPVASALIGNEVVADGVGGWNPDTPVLRRVDPTSVGRERLIEVLLVRRRLRWSDVSVLRRRDVILRADRLIVLKLIFLGEGSGGEAGKRQGAGGDQTCQPRPGDP